MLLVRLTSKKKGLLVRMLLVSFVDVFTSKGLLVKETFFTSKTVVTSKPMPKFRIFTSNFY